MIRIIKGIIFGKQNKNIISKSESKPSNPQFLQAQIPQQDPNHEREILRKKALITHSAKDN